VSPRAREDDFQHAKNLEPLSGTDRFHDHPVRSLFTTPTEMSGVRYWIPKLHINVLFKSANFKLKTRERTSKTIRPVSVPKIN